MNRPVLVPVQVPVRSPAAGGRVPLALRATTPLWYVLGPLTRIPLVAPAAIAAAFILILRASRARLIGLPRHLRLSCAIGLVAVRVLGLIHMKDLAGGSSKREAACCRVAR